MTKDVPFYANRKDGMSCALAVYRSIIEYLLSKKLTWAELEAITGYNPGIAAWSVKPLVYFAKHGLDVCMIEPVDYRRFMKEGLEYFEKEYPPEQLAWSLEHSNLAEIKPYIPSFLDTVEHECRRATLEDIDTLLKDDRLVFVTLNSRVLNDRPGFVSHAILILEKDSTAYIAHDPGLPPRAYRRIKFDKLWQAMGGQNNVAEVTGFKALAL